MRIKKSLSNEFSSIKRNLIKSRYRKSKRSIRLCKIYVRWHVVCYYLIEIVRKIEEMLVLGKFVGLFNFKFAVKLIFQIYKIKLMVIPS